MASEMFNKTGSARILSLLVSSIIPPAQEMGRWIPNRGFLPSVYVESADGLTAYLDIAGQDIQQSLPTSAYLLLYSTEYCVKANDGNQNFMPTQV